PWLRCATKKFECRRFHALGLCEIDVIARLHRAHAAHACIFVGETTDHVVQQSFPQRAVRDAHLLDPEYGENLGQDGQPAEKDRSALGAQAVELESAQMTRSQHIFDERFERVRRDRAVVIAVASLAQDLSHGANRARGTGRARPPERLERDFHGSKLQARRESRAFHAPLRDGSIVEKGTAHADAAHVKALQLLRLQAFSHDELGTAAPDVHDEAAAGLAGRRVGDAEVDEPRLFDTGDDVDRMPERDARAIEKSTLAARAPQRVRTDGANARRLHIRKPLTESLEAFDCSLYRGALQATLLIESGSQADHFSQAIDDDELPVRIPGNDHVKAIGAEIDGGDD